MNKLMSKFKVSFSIIITLTIIGILIYGSLSWARYSHLFQKHSIVILGNSIIDDSEIRNIILQEIGTDLLTEDISSLTSKIEEHPYIAGARVSKHFPTGILVEISERYPIAMINHNPLLLLDHYGTIIPIRKNSFDLQVPIVSNLDISDEEIEIGEKTSSIKIDDIVKFINRVHLDYPKLYKNLSEIRLSDNNDYELILEEEPTKIVIGKSIEWSKMIILKEFEKNLKGRKSLTDYVYLDLRYDNQVITKERRA